VRHAVLLLAAALLVACESGPADLTVGAVEFRGPPGSLAPRLGVTGDRAVLSWLEPAGAGRHALRVATLADTGWVPAGTVVVHDSLFVNWADVPSVLPLTDGTWLAHWLEKTAPSTYAYHVRMALSSDAGRTWGAPFSPHGDRSPTEHGFVAMVPWGGGAAAVWLDGRNTLAPTRPPAHPPTRGAEGEGGAGPMSLRFTTIRSSGAVAPDVELDARVCDCCQTAIAPTRHGLLVAYRDRSPAEIRDIVVTRLVDDQWTAPRPVADDGWYYPGCPVNGPAVATAGDTVVVVWFTAAHDTARVFAAISHDGGARFGPRVRIHDERPVGRVDVVWWRGAALVAWLEETADAGAVRVRRLAADGRPGPAVTVAPTSVARAAGFPRLAPVGTAVLVAWTDPEATGGVRVARVRGGS